MVADLIGGTRKGKRRIKMQAERLEVLEFEGRTSRKTERLVSAGLVVSPSERQTPAGKAMNERFRQVLAQSYVPVVSCGGDVLLRRR